MNNVNQSQEQKQLNVQGSGALPAADAPPAVLLTPDMVVEQLRALRTQMPNVDPLTDQERKLARGQARLGLSAEALQASINVIGATDAVAQGVEMPFEDARQFADETGHWTAVEAELKRFLGGVADANLIRRQRLGILAAKAYGIARQVGRDNPEVRTHVKEIARLRALTRRKKPATTTPQTPAPPVTPAPAPSTEPSTALSTKSTQ
jgi:hypothetical protein